MPTVLLPTLHTASPLTPTGDAADEYAATAPEGVGFAPAAAETLGEGGPVTPAPPSEPARDLYQTAALQALTALPDSSTPPSAALPQAPDPAADDIYDFLSLAVSWENWAREQPPKSAGGVSSATLHGLNLAAGWLLNILADNRVEEWPEGTESSDVWTERAIRLVHEIVDQLLAGREIPSSPLPENAPGDVGTGSDGGWSIDWHNLFATYPVVFEFAGNTVIDRASRELVADYLSLRFGKTFYHAAGTRQYSAKSVFSPAYLTALSSTLAAASALPADLFPPTWRTDGERFLAAARAIAARTQAGEEALRLAWFAAAAVD